jgi:hypothetical protein
MGSQLNRRRLPAFAQFSSFFGAEDGTGIFLRTLPDYKTTQYRNSEDQNFVIKNFQVRIAAKVGYLPTLNYFAVYFVKKKK